MITPSSKPSQPPTRERLLREGLRLFASQGFTATTVGQIESAAGLKPRRGGFYHYYPSKEALLHAAAERYSSDEYKVVAEYASIPIDDPRGSALLIGRWLLTHLDGQRELIQILERDGERIPKVAAGFRAGTDVAFALGTELMMRWFGDRYSRLDAEALCVALCGGLINFRRSTWTAGAPPLGLDDQRLLDAFATLFTNLVVAGPSATRHHGRHGDTAPHHGS